MRSAGDDRAGPGALRARLAAAGLDVPPDAAELERALALHARRLRDLEAVADLGPGDAPFPTRPAAEPAPPSSPAGPGGPEVGSASPGGPEVGSAGPGGPEVRSASPGGPAASTRVISDPASAGGGADTAVPGLVEAAVLVRDGDLTSVALVERVLGRIEAADGRLGAFVSVLAGQALGEAAARDAERARGRLRGPLHGVPVAVKDLVDVTGAVTGAGSPKLAANLADADAEVVARLRGAGAVVVGKTRTHEFAYGVHTPGTTNPWDPERIAGGSSGGSAAAVAAGLVPLAVGSDTAGSIRIPAACCGVVGLKPTHGAVPATGVWPLAWSCDHVGPITRDVADAAVAFAVLAGRSLPPPGGRRDVAGLRLGWLVGEGVEAVDPGVARVMGEVRARLAAAGAMVDEVRLPLRAARAAVGAIVLPELAAAHARLLAETGEEGYGPPVLAAIRLGQAALASEYLAGLRYRGRFSALVEEALSGRDALVLPTVPVPAPRHEEHTVVLGGVRAGVQAALTALPGSFNCSGSPVVSLPAGLASRAADEVASRASGGRASRAADEVASRASGGRASRAADEVAGGMPVGVSLVGRLGRDGELLETAASVEAVLPALGLPPAWA